MTDKFTRINWSANQVPSIGDVFVSRINYLGGWGEPILPAGTKLVVKGFDVEHGFLYALCEPKDARAKAKMLAHFKKDNRYTSPYVYVAGCDVEAWGSCKELNERDD
jgi:hypothetical protein